MAPELPTLAARRWLASCVLAAALAWPGAASAQSSPEDVLKAVVLVTSEVPADARTAQALGTSREGSGVVIDDDGLVLTIGYLILEAMSVTIHSAEAGPVLADVVAYDHQTGFGLLRARDELGAKPLRLGDSGALAEEDRVLVVAFGGAGSVRGALVAARREFAGYWEYLLERAIFTVPPHPMWSGAALVGRDGKLLGIGSLIVADALRGETALPGNMFVPVDLLKPILADLLSEGRRSGPKQPWLGMFATNVPGGALVTHVAPGGPAQRAGIEPGDIVTGVAEQRIADLPDFYRKLWAQGDAGIEVSLTVRRGTRSQSVTIVSADRESYLRMRPSY